MIKSAEWPGLSSISEGGIRGVRNNKGIMTREENRRLRSRIEAHQAAILRNEGEKNRMKCRKVRK
jgi:hypothetical protein